MSRINSRIVVLSSSNWRGVTEAKVALRSHVEVLSEYGTVTLVLGEGRSGAEKTAKSLWRRWAEEGFTVENFVAHKEIHGRSAGARRNQAILDAGVSVALVFLTERDPDLLDFIKRCKEARVRVELYQGTSSADHAPIPLRSAGGAG